MLGSTVVAFFMFWLGAVTATGVAANAPHGDVEYWLFRYQTLIAGTFAIGAAAIGAHAVQQQMKQADTLAEGARQRKARATRTMLPSALASIMDYSEQCLTAMNGLRGQCVGHTLPSPVPEPPGLIETPDDALALMRDYVEHANDEAALAIATLISKLQVQRSRSAEVFRHAHGIPARATPLSLNLETYLVDAAELYARAAVLFGHAREAQAVPALTSGDVRSALNLMGMNDLTDAELYGRLDRRVWA